MRTSHVAPIGCAAAAIVVPLAAFSVARWWAVTRGLARWYFLAFRWERWQKGRCYRWLGVRQFKYWLPWSGDWVARRSGKHPLWSGGRTAAIDAAFQNAVLHELIHLFILIPLLPVPLMAFCDGSWRTGLFTVALNVIGNV